MDERRPLTRLQSHSFYFLYSFERENFFAFKIKTLDLIYINDETVRLTRRWSNFVYVKWCLPSVGLIAEIITRPSWLIKFHLSSVEFSRITTKPYLNSRLFVIVTWICHAGLTLGFSPFVNPSLDSEGWKSISLQSLYDCLLKTITKWNSLGPELL